MVNTHSHLFEEGGVGGVVQPREVSEEEEDEEQVDGSHGDGILDEVGLLQMPAFGQKHH